MSLVLLPYTVIRIVAGTTSATIGTQTTHAHGGGKVPAFYLIKPKSNGVVYESAVPDATNIYVKGSAASLTFDLIVFFTI
jgi:hypothetical protein